MDPSPHLSPQTESTDVFSLTDEDLAEKLQFVEEIGFGNWGSVWLCRPKLSPDINEDDLVKNNEQKIAVKLVHRSKTATTAARVRSLWNEMKIVRTFKSDPHPAIIPFHSFIITPSYALITMTYLPTLIPVEVNETRARHWFRLLLSGIEFLHKRGIVHNDIKPANILLSEKNIPVLVDFGFAEKYDLYSSTAFHSNLSYGTPEYLSPERARGLPHDTRKSDVWSLGITFFEILAGRTPFECSDGEQFTTKDELEQYWSRTLRGKWVGTWKMSQGLERLLCRMIASNTDLRCTATDAMADEYWELRSIANVHKRSASYHSYSPVNSNNMTPPKKVKENSESPPGLENVLRIDTNHHVLARSKLQSGIGGSKKNAAHPRKRAAVAPIIDLSPIKASPPATPTGKENTKVRVLNSCHKSDRKPFGNVNNIPQPQFVKSVDGGSQSKRRSKVLGDSTARHFNNEKVINGKKPKEVQSKEKVSHVKDRVRDWERERERLREMQRLEDLEREQEELEGQMLNQEIEVVKEVDQEKRPAITPSLLQIPSSAPSSAAVSSSGDTALRRSSNSGLSHLKHNIKKSIDKTKQFYKSSTLGRSTPRTTSFDLLDDATRAEPPSEHLFWEDETLVRDAANSSLPAVRHAFHNEIVSADAKADRMTIWMRNVERVVEDARQTFALSAPQPTVLPPLPVAPLPRPPSNSRPNRGRLPHKILAASQIFTEENTVSLNDSATNSSYVNQSKADVSENTSQILSSMESPSRRRRATVSTRSPEPLIASTSNSDSGENIGLAEKLQLHITTFSKLEAELNKPPQPEPSLRLSQVIDRSLFIQTPLLQKYSVDMNQEDTLPSITSSTDDFSILHVEAYPSRKPSSQNTTVPSSPEQRRLENVYDRFLMATSSVKRVGKGYQSDIVTPVCNVASSAHNETHQRRKRHVMPPPVSSEDMAAQPAVVVDEMGMMTCVQPGTGIPIMKDESNTTVAMVRRAIKAMVPGKTVSKRLSRVMV